MELRTRADLAVAVVAVVAEVAAEQVEEPRPSARGAQVRVPHAGPVRLEHRLVAVRVDGVFDSDPEKVKDAMKFDEISYMEVVKRGLKVMDTTAITLSMDNKLPIIVFNFDIEGNLNRLVLGESVGTKVQE